MIVIVNTLCSFLKRDHTAYSSICTLIALGYHVLVCIHMQDTSTVKKREKAPSLNSWKVSHSYFPQGLSIDNTIMMGQNGDGLHPKNMEAHEVHNIQ